MVTKLDQDVGRLIALLRELELDRNTLVIFTSDNGPHSEGGHKHEFFDSNGPLRGYKRDLYEGGVRTPTIAWWPGVIAPGTSNDQPLAAYDWLPTACELAGVEAPENIDGISYLPVLQGRKQPRQHDFLYWSYEKKRAVRMGNWKAVSANQGKKYELFDLSDDLGEQVDVSESHPLIVEQIREIAKQATGR